MSERPFSRAVERLVSDAIRAGFVVTDRPGGVVLWKWSEHKNPRRRKIVAGVDITLWDDGRWGQQAYRLDTGDLSVCTNIRTLKAVRKVLGLTSSGASVKPQ
jgi:hypothetical protein